VQSIEEKRRALRSRSFIPDVMKIRHDKGMRTQQQIFAELLQQDELAATLHRGSTV
jgi:hypothetical protein